MTGILPAAALLTEIHQPDYFKQLETLSERIHEKNLCPVLPPTIESMSKLRSSHKVYGIQLCGAMYDDHNVLWGNCSIGIGTFIIIYYIITNKKIAVF